MATVIVLSTFLLIWFKDREQGKKEKLMFWTRIFNLEVSRSSVPRSLMVKVAFIIERFTKKMTIREGRGWQVYWRYYVLLWLMTSSKPYSFSLQNVDFSTQQLVSPEPHKCITRAGLFLKNNFSTARNYKGGGPTFGSCERGKCRIRKG